jgi:hypothetical protein
VAILSNAVTIADAGAFSASLGSMVLIKTLTASSSANLTFVHGASSVVLDSTYPIYQFEFINCHASGNADYLSVNFSVDSGSNYNVAKTSTAFRAYHTEDNSAASVDYLTDYDLAQGTGLQYLTGSLGNVNDESVSGTFNLFNPSSTTFVKHYIYRGNHSFNADGNIDFYAAGYGNTTSAINAVRFQMSSGTIDSGKIKLYGIKDS